MSFSFRNYHCPNIPSNSLFASDSNVVNDPGYSARVSENNIMPSNLAKPKLVNIHLNPNSLISSGSIHINKNKFIINQSALVNPSIALTKDNSYLGEKKIHYNPKFFQKAESVLPFESKNTVDSSKSKTIYVNPSFTKILSKGNQSKTHLKSNFQVRPYEFHETVNHTNEPPLSSEKILVNPDFIDQLSSSSLSNSLTKDFACKVPSVTNPIVCTEPPVSNSVSVKTVPTFESKYCKVNKHFPIRKNPQISKYKIQRYCSNANIKQLSPSKLAAFKNVRVPNRKPRLSGSFKKIGKRKLVRNSLIQNYILSRRRTIPAMMLHSRNTFATKKRLSHSYKNKYKYVRGNKLSSVPLKHKFTSLPSKSQLKWNRNDSRSHDFIKIGKRKIVRKSILQTIIEARRSKFYSSWKFLNKKQLSPNQKNTANMKTLKSRFKVVRNVSASQSSQPNGIVSQRSFTSSKKKDFTFTSQFPTSKSVLYRMPPSLRMKLRMELRQKRQLLMKKVNNRKKCLFYNRFGFCRGQDNGSCKKLHDVKSISVCRKFLKGLCDGTNCKLCHEVLPEKMPVCYQFLAGVCIRSSCPFLHVKLSDDHPICTDFLQGFCQHGNSCMKRHQFICPEWSEKGTCKIDKCPYSHAHSHVDSKDNSKLSGQDVSLPLDSLKQESRGGIIQNLSEEITDRYFTSESNFAKLFKNSKRLKTEKKPDVKDGVNSVYKDDSLLLFIPFS